jgi:hypothetical protein
LSRPYLLDLTDIANSFTNLTSVKRIVVTIGASLGVLEVRVFPRLGESAVVPDVTCRESA